MFSFRVSFSDSWEMHVEEIVRNRTFSDCRRLSDGIDGRNSESVVIVVFIFFLLRINGS